MADAAINALFDGAQPDNPNTIICANCGAVAPRRKVFGAQKYCEACRLVIKAENSRRASKKYAAAKGTMPSGCDLLCEWCRMPFISRAGGNKFCSKSCRDEFGVAARWRRRVKVVDRNPKQIIMCECCFEAYEYLIGSDKNRCPACISSEIEITLKQLWEKFCYRKSSDGIAERKRKYFRFHHDRKRLQSDYVLSERMSAALRRGLRGGKQGRSWRDLVPYSLTSLKEHLERKFVDGMCWENYGSWHIDHIRPISSFKYSDATDQAFVQCWSLNNLQPLWAEDNIRKGSSINYYN